MKRQLQRFVTAIVLAFSVANAAYAERYVVVNGNRLSDTDIMILERLRCGPIPNGHYWLNFNTGIWGYAGNPRMQGHITDNCYNPGRRPSLSERGMLFYPGELAQ